LFEVLPLFPLRWPTATLPKMERLSSPPGLKMTSALEEKDGGINELATKIPA
jgi:hypothetical protein